MCIMLPLPLPLNSSLAYGLLLVVGALCAAFIMRSYLLQRASENPSEKAAIRSEYPHLHSSPPTRRPFAGLHDQKNGGGDGGGGGVLTPTGFSEHDIKALGRFPDYAVLSGVPHPQPYNNFNIHKAMFRPYRPFRWNYHQTMALMKFDPNFWIELEQNYFETMKKRQQLLAKYGTKVLNFTRESEQACRELMEMVVQFLCIRYPQYFQLEAGNTKLHNRLLSTVSDLEATPPLRVVFDNVPEDFAIVVRDDDTGYYHLRAGSICSTLGWNLHTKMNKSLAEIHEPVADFKEKMLKSVDRYFSKMPTDQPISRGSWSIEDWKALFVPPEEAHLRSHFAHEPVHERRAEKCFLRVDWQTLRRLPVSGAVVFNFKAIFTPLEELRHEPFIPALLHKQFSDGKPSLLEDKAVEDNKGLILDALNRWKEEQVKAGIVPADWAPATLHESPFFQGWEQTWHRKQGF